MTGPPRPRRVAWAVVGGLLGLAAVVLVLLREHNTLSAFTGEVERPRVLLTLPEFVLENEGGESFGLLDLRGHIFVADFIFTRCAGTCPMITHRMAALQDELAADHALQEVRFVSFSVDPDNDRPAVLRDYAATVHADARRWTFLTGTRDAVRGVVRDGFKMPVEDQDDAAMPVMHSQSFVLVDRVGRVRGVYDPLSEEGLAALKHALAAVVAETPPKDLFFPHDAGDPRWFALRQREQQAAGASLRAPHDFRFRDRLGASGIRFRNLASQDLAKFYRPTHYDHGTALVAADVDGDGLPDLYFANQAGPNALYRNLGGGRFEDITAAASLSGHASADQAGGAAGSTGATLAVGDRACVGASFADIDNDGDPDLFVTSVRQGNLLFRNDGHGRFEDITEAAGVAGHGEHSSGAVFFDYDGDGRLDLFVTSVGVFTGDERRADGLWVSFPDSFAGHLHPERSETSILYHNLGGGRFEEASKTSGLVHTAWSGDATPFDYDGDGRIDLYVASMQGHDDLWRNLGGGRFEKRSREVFPATPWGSMGLKVLDWNGDGRLDLLVTDMHTDMAGDLRPEDERRKHDPAAMFPPRFLGTDGRHILGNALFTSAGPGHGDGGGETEPTYIEMSDSANVETGWPWGPSLGDLNADGWPDLFIAAGMNFPYRYHGNDVLLSDAGGRFVNAEFLLGVEPRARTVHPWFSLDCDGPDAEHPICQGEQVSSMSLDGRGGGHGRSQEALHGEVTVWASRASRSAVLLDLDGDGDLDVVTNDYGDMPQVLISDLAQRGKVNFITVRLKGTRSNRDGLGAVVTLRAAGRNQVQVNDGKSGYLAQSSLPLYFGLGVATSADAITVRWPDGRQQVRRGPVPAGATIVIEER
jgi:cytochrome oxidase Cu insertion factor (SCO1/SenC/PrrC family)